LDLIQIITADDAKIRDASLDAFCRDASAQALLDQCKALDAFRRQSENLYQRVRALLFLYAIHRFHLPAKPGYPTKGRIPFDGYAHLLNRRFEEAIDSFQSELARNGPSDAISSALAAAYHDLGFQTLANQVRRSVRSVRGNQWMFRIGHPADQPLRIRPELLARSELDGSFPILSERTPVRMDLTHSGWSDIFFLGMDFPQGARVLNVSIDLAVRGRDPAPKPPVEAYVRVIDESVLRLVSVDLGARADITNLPDIFDFAKDYLGLLKAAVIASGLVPPGMEGSGRTLEALLTKLVGPGLGLEIVSSVNNIPKGSRLAVSTNLLGSLISALMRATSQAKSVTGDLSEDERRVVAARAILGEWIGGSGGGWQDSGGVWPGIKLICGSLAEPGDPEFGVSRGRLLPTHRILGQNDVSPQTREQLQSSLVLVHGGMAQNVGPILEMVTEKYLLRSEAEWAGRMQAIGILDQILAALKAGDIPSIGKLTTQNFFEPIQTIIPWATNLYTETLIRRVREKFERDFWGFWMLGGMSGGGMGFIFSPAKKAEAQAYLQDLMSATKRQLQNALPFAMEPVVYDFGINTNGTFATLLEGERALLPSNYYAMMAPQWLRTDPRELTPMQRVELERFGSACRQKPELAGMVQTLFDRLVPRSGSENGGNQKLANMLESLGFDREQHEQIRSEMKSGRTGLAQNRLAVSTIIEDVQGEDVDDLTAGANATWTAMGRAALADGRVAVLSLAAGVGSRWTQGAGVVKALHPFCKLGGKHRSFLEVHLAKSRRIGRQAGTPLPHLIATSYLTHDAIEQFLSAHNQYGYEGPLRLSRGRAVGLRMIPMVRDLRFAWEEMPQKRLDEQQQKVRESLHAALINWATAAGEGNDYTDNIPSQCLHPVGHWYEVPNLLRNGILAQLLTEHPTLRYLMLHNIDTVGADVDPTLLGLHIARGSCLTFEVINRRIDDRGGGLARVDGRPRLLEGLAMPREAAEFALSYYNSMTTWIDFDQLLRVFNLTRGDLSDEPKVTSAVRKIAARMPTYITLKDVKKRWGHGQEDVFPVAQFEKLWGDMTALPDITCGFVVVPRSRGQQLKDQAQLDAWLRDGSAAYVESICEWE
ncbi:MAG TPA: UTP--glucose-1-phosphate uridylyltransferase, partial [Tepidisphaeraceae bacterium]|nr:UTP--glucose-1-phosphate uridylyltransferase [Tepidisphaeraceae bacterium]